MGGTEALLEIFYKAGSEELTASIGEKRTLVINQDLIVVDVLPKPLISNKLSSA